MSRYLTRRALASTLALALALSPALAESGSEAAPRAVEADTTASSPGALPPGFRKRASEDPWRRFEIVAFGAFPILLFYVDLGFDIGTFIAKDFDSRYAPWPFKSDASIDPDEGEYLVRLAVTAGASLAFSGIDALIRAIRYRADAELDSAGQPD